MAIASDDDKENDLHENITDTYETLDRGRLVELCYRKDKIIRWYMDAYDELCADW